MNAQDWIDIEPYGIKSDIERYGIDKTAEIQMDLIEDSLSIEDFRWKDITLEEMKAALTKLWESDLEYI